MCLLSFVCNFMIMKKFDFCTVLILIIKTLQQQKIPSFKKTFALAIFFVLICCFFFSFVYFYFTFHCCIDLLKQHLTD